MKRKKHWEVDRLNRFQQKRMARWVRQQLRSESRRELVAWRGGLHEMVFRGYPESERYSRRWRG